MPDRNYTIIFQADTTQATAALHQFEMQIKMFEASISSSGAAVQQSLQPIAQMNAALNNSAPALQAVGHAAKQNTTDILAMGSAMIGLQMAAQLAVQAIGQLGDKANQARDRIKEIALETMDLRDKMRELANLQGAPGPNNAVVAKAVAAGMEAGMLPDEIRKYMEQYEGSSPAGLQKRHIDRATSAKLAIEGAKFGNRMKISPQTAGDLAGVIPQYTNLMAHKVGGDGPDKDELRETPSEGRVPQAMEQMGRVAYGLNEGRGNLEPLVKSLLNTAGAVVGGPVEDLAELAAIQGVASTHANPKEAGTRVRQAVRALRETRGEAGNFLTNALKISDSDTHIQRLEKLKQFTDVGIKDGKSRYAQLRALNFNDEDEIRAVVEQVEDLGIIKERIQKGKAITGKSVMELDEHFLTGERTGVRKMQMAKRAGQEFLMGDANERIEMAKETAEQQLREEKAIGGTGNNVKEWAEDLGGLVPFFGGEKARERVKFHRAERNLIAEAERVGIPVDEARKIIGYREIVRDDTPSRVAEENKTRNPNFARTKAEAMAQIGGLFGRSPLDAIRDSMTKEQARIEQQQARYVHGTGQFLNPKDDETRRAGFNKLAVEVERKRGNPYGEGPDLTAKFDDLIAETRTTNRILSGIPKEKDADEANATFAHPMPQMRHPVTPKRP